MFFFFHYFLATSMTNCAHIFTGLIFYAYVGIHQVRILVFDSYQKNTLPFNCPSKIDPILFSILKSVKIYKDSLIKCNMNSNSQSCLSREYCLTIFCLAEKSMIPVPKCTFDMVVWMVTLLW